MKISFLQLSLLFVISNGLVQGDHAGMHGDGGGVRHGDHAGAYAGGGDDGHAGHGATTPEESSSSTCACPLLKRPVHSELEASARWMVHTLDWGILSTISTRLEDSPPFGNVYSFVDGPCEESTGTPYFYGSHMDQSFIDNAQNNAVSFTLSEAALPFTCGASNLQGCAISANGGDPENPMCARLTLTGKLIELEHDSEEYKKVQSWFFHRHAAMAQWPVDHEWVIAKLVIEDIWFIDFFGGANIVSPENFHGLALNTSDIDHAAMSMHSHEYSDAFATAHQHSHSKTQAGAGGSSSSGSTSDFTSMASLFMIVCAGSILGNFIVSRLCGSNDRLTSYKYVESTKAQENANIY